MEVTPMSKLTKSLAELESIADEILAKSQQMEDIEDEQEDKAEELEKSEDAVEDEESEEDLEKSENAEEDEEENTEEENLEKSEDNEEINPEDISENAPEDEVKSAEPEEDEEKDEEEDEKAEEKKEDLAKSLKQEFESNPVIKQSIDASEFLAAVTEVMSKSLANIAYNVLGGSRQSADSNDVLAKSLNASLRMNKSMAEEMEALRKQNRMLKKSIATGFEDLKGYLDDKMEDISHQPASLRKSVGNVSVHDRNFNKSLGSMGCEQLSKSEVLTKLNTLMYSGNPMVQPTDIISYESGAPLRPEVANLINNM